MKIKTPALEIITENLYDALLLDGKMSYTLYECELKEHISFWKKGMRRDSDELLFAVVENNGDVAMLLIDKKGALFINEEARSSLQLFWKVKNVYQQNIEYLLPMMVVQLSNNEISVNGVKYQE